MSDYIRDLNQFKKAIYVLKQKNYFLINYIRIKISKIRIKHIRIDKIKLFNYIFSFKKIRALDKASSKSGGFNWLAKVSLSCSELALFCKKRRSNSVVTIKGIFLRMFLRISD